MYMLHKLRVIQSIRSRDNQVRLSVTRVFVAFVPFAMTTRAVSADFIRFLTKVSASLSAVTEDYDSGHRASQRATPRYREHDLQCILSLSFRATPRLRKVSRYARRLSTVKLCHSLGPTVSVSLSEYRVFTNGSLRLSKCLTGRWRPGLRCGRF